MKHVSTLLKLLLWLIIGQLPSLLGAQFVYTNLDWFHTLAKPSFMPPDALFGIMWGLLYLLLGISGFLAFRHKLHGKAMMLFVGQLALNACWTPVFFGAHSLLGGLVLIVTMLIALVFLFRALWPISRVAAWLLVPYGLWLAFATYLTAATWWMN